MAVAPSDADALCIDAAIRGLISSGIWAKLDCFWMPGQATEQAATLNWKQTAFNLTVVRTGGNMPFTPYQGWHRTDANPGYIRTGFNPSTAGGLYTQNSACIGLYSLTDSVGTFVDMGFVDGANLGANIAMDFDFSIGQRLGRLNGTISPDVAPTRSVGHQAISRLISTEFHFYHDDYDTTSIVANNSTGLPNGEFYLGAWNLNGTAANVSDRAYPCAHIGGGLTTSELQTLSQIISTFQATVTTTGYDVIGLIGQSNGYTGAFVVRGTDTVTQRVLQMRLPGDYPALYVDKADFPDRFAAAFNFVSFALTFGRDYYVPNQLAAGRRLLFVPCGFGGTSLVATADWAAPNGPKYLEWVRRANIAMQLPNAKYIATFCMIGESDTVADEDATIYGVAMDKMISESRSSITGASASPFILGNMVPAWPSGHPVAQAAIYAKNADTPNRVSRCAYANPLVPTEIVSTTGIHYDAINHRTGLAPRFYAALNSFPPVLPPITEDWTWSEPRDRGSFGVIAALKAMQNRSNVTEETDFNCFLSATDATATADTDLTAESLTAFVQPLDSATPFAPLTLTLGNGISGVTSQTLRLTLPITQASGFKRGNVYVVEVKAGDEVSQSRRVISQGRVRVNASAELSPGGV